MMLYTSRLPYHARKWKSVARVSQIWSTNIPLLRPESRGISVRKSTFGTCSKRVSVCYLSCPSAQLEISHRTVMTRNKISQVHRARFSTDPRGWNYMQISWVRGDDGGKQENFVSGRFAERKRETRWFAKCLTQRWAILHGRGETATSKL